MAKNLKRRKFKKEISSKKPVQQEAKFTEHKSNDQNKSFYYKYYKQLLVIPMLMLVIAMVLIGVQYSQTGDFINRGISLKGGTSFTITNDMANLENTDIVNLKSNLHSSFPDSDIEIRELKDISTRKAIVIEVDISTSENKEKILEFEDAILSQIPDLDKENLENNVQTTSSALGNVFFSQMLKALIAAFIFMGIVVLIQFRVLIPSFAVMLSAFSDIVVTLAIVNLLGIKLSTAGIAAFLMLIGYSVDTDILMSSRVLKNKTGTVYSRIISSLKTGMLMNITTLSAVIIALLVSQSDVIVQIMTILFIGLLVDMVNTWIQNAAILRWYAEKVEK